MLRFSLLFLLGAAASSCGYNLRGNTRPFFDQHHISKLYVSPVKNNSYKAGVEIVVYNALRKRIAQGGYVSLVDSAELADATMSAFVQDASTIPATTTSADQLSPLKSGPTTIQVATAYVANLRVKFHHKRLWGDELARGKIYQANTYLGSLGSTSALINESEFDVTLNDLSVSIVTDAEESINTIF